VELIEMDNKMNRKEFLKQLPILGIALCSGGLLLQGCSKSQTEEDPCADVSTLTAEEKQTRKDFEYVSKSPFPDKLCENCELWVAPKEGNFCGACEIMEGPIHPKGYCNSWVKAS